MYFILASVNIAVNDGVLLGGNRKAFIFMLANPVFAHTNLGKKERKEVLGFAARIILFDHGFRKHQGVSEIWDVGHAV